MPKTIREAGPLGVTAKRSGRIEVQLITPGWGSSGHYSAKVLENAANAGIWGPGHQLFLDHPGEEERYDRPERSVKDLAATLVEAARWDAERQAVVGEAQTFGPWADTLLDEHFAAAIGVSIRAFADTTVGEADGRKGTIITEITEAVSTDFVTRAGRGGAILAVLESARPEQITERAVARGVAQETVNDTRAALSDALKAAYGGDKTWVWVRDFDESTVWFDYEAPDQQAIYQQGYTLTDAGAVELAAGGPLEVRARTEYVPVTPAAESGATNVPAPAGQHHPIKLSEEDTMPQIEESRLAQLEADAGRATLAESERDSAIRERDEAIAANALFRTREAARPAVTRTIAESGLPSRRQARLVESVLANVQADTTPEAVADATSRAIADEQADIAELAESIGVGAVRGFGSTVAESTGYSVDDFDAAFSTKEG